MNRRALSDIVVLILVILLALAAVMILWSFLRVFFLGAGLDTELITNRFSIVSDSVLDVEGESVELNVRKDEGDTEMVGIIVSLEDENGKVVNKRFPGEIKLFETMKISYDYIEEGLGRVDVVSISPVFMIDGEEKIGGVADRYVIGGVDRVSWTLESVEGFAGVAENVDNGESDHFWENVNNVKSDIDGDAFARVATTAGAVSDYLLVTNFSFDIREDGRVTVITGVEVEVRRREVDRPVVDSNVNLILGGVGVGEDKAEGTINWGDIWEIKIYGGENDGWGWTEGELSLDNIEKDSFGFSLATGTPGFLSSDGADVDYIKMIVHYKVLE